MSLYAAYGTNLNAGQMMYRCPDACDRGSGILRGRRLVFRMNVNGHAVASVEEAEDSFVPVRLWEIQSWDEETLDHFQGFHFKPPIYRKISARVETSDSSVEAFFYVLTDPYASFGIPSPSYCDSMLRGYRECRFELEPLRRALLLSGYEYPKLVNDGAN